MSSKLGLILSMLFVVMFFLFGVDLICVQFLFSDLDAKSISISYLISQHGGLDSELVNQIEDTYKVDFKCLNNCYPSFGDIVDYQISTDYSPLIMSNEVMHITVYRSTAIGFYG